ncbi:MAG: bifunctional pyr operon transcriptional regulator/uracil phosphoribosyltransferase PyrR [Holophagaceae bacterium]|nr:bifunctional pyr operon transcriptional regulator/uracil phosphoribosyltransferase PyrR [Holophagaceae bacterium]
MPPGTCQLDAAQLDATLTRMAEELASRLGPDEPIAVLGIRSRGLPLAERLAARLSASTHRAAPMGALDITLYRDDLTERAGAPIVRPTEIPFTLKERTVILVDDVLFTGRTIRAALDALLDHGRPRKVLLAVLVDRGGRELPIQADVVGTTLKVAWGERVSVKVKELDGEDGVFVEPKD